VQVPSPVKLTVRTFTVQLPDAVKDTVKPDVLEAETVNGPGKG
jgi:hypothetical protein